jgi:septal ring factor EnvC (AmiA/AmiB activator)
MRVVASLLCAFLAIAACNDDGDAPTVPAWDRAGKAREEARARRAEAQAAMAKDRARAEAMQRQLEELTARQQALDAELQAMMDALAAAHGDAERLRAQEQLQQLKQRRDALRRQLDQQHRAPRGGVVVDPKCRDNPLGC